MATAARQQPRWEAIRPWTDRISLQVKELTSISATFILSSVGAGKDDLLGENELLRADENQVEEEEHLATRSLRDILARGFTVKVNGTRWPNVFPHIEEDNSEAVIILYGLHPGRQYEIEIAIDSDSVALREEFETPDDINSDGPSLSEGDADGSNGSVEASPQISSPDDSLSQDLTPPVTPDSPSPPKSLTIEERTAQLKLSLASLTQEHESLANQLKMARKESQRSENAVRAEIETLKKAAEKQAVADQRAKQKVLALQEAIKQTHSAALDIESQTRALQDELPGITQEVSLVEEDYNTVSETSEKKEAETDLALKADKKRVAEAQAELTSVTNRTEKLTLKREKLAHETVPELEHQLAEVRREIDQLEAQKEQFSRIQLAVAEGVLTPHSVFSPQAYKHVMRQTNLPRPTAARPIIPMAPGRSSFPPINASAAPFYPRVQPSIISRNSLPLTNARPANDFRPFDTPLTHAEPGTAYPSYSNESQS